MEVDDAGISYSGDGLEDGPVVQIRTVIVKFANHQRQIEAKLRMEVECIDQPRRNLLVFFELDFSLGWIGRYHLRRPGRYLLKILLDDRLLRTLPVIGLRNSNYARDSTISLLTYQRMLADKRENVRSLQACLRVVKHKWKEAQQKLQLYTKTPRESPDYAYDDDDDYDEDEVDYDEDEVDYDEDEVDYDEDDDGSRDDDDRPEENISSQSRKRLPSPTKSTLPSKKISFAPPIPPHQFASPPRPLSGSHSI